MLEEASVFHLSENKQLVCILVLLVLTCLYSVMNARTTIIKITERIIATLSCVPSKVVTMSSSISLSIWLSVVLDIWPNATPTCSVLTDSLLC